MIIGICVVAFVLLFFGALVLHDERRGKVIEEKKAVQEIVKRSDPVKIQQLEATELGIGLEMLDLPGYYWVVSRGISWTHRDKVKTDPNGLQIILLNGNHDIIEERMVTCEVYVDRYTTRKRTAEEMEVQVRSNMKAMKKRALEKVRLEQGLTDLVEKYNGKSVIQDS